jgi:hypothetical protein
MTVEVAGTTASCGFPALSLRAPSETADGGFNALEDACSGAGFGRLFSVLLFGGAGVVVIMGSRRWRRRRTAGVEE